MDSNRRFPYFYHLRVTFKQILLGLGIVCLLVIMGFLFGEVSSSFWCLGWAVLFFVALPEPSV